MHSRNVSIGLEFTSCIVIVILFSLSLARALQFIIDYIRTSLVQHFALCLHSTPNDTRIATNIGKQKKFHFSITNTKYCTFTSPRRMLIYWLCLFAHGNLQNASWLMESHVFSFLSFEKISKLRFPRPLQKKIHRKFVLFFVTFLIHCKAIFRLATKSCNTFRRVLFRENILWNSFLFGETEYLSI